MVSGYILIPRIDTIPPITRRAQILIYLTPGLGILKSYLHWQSLPPAETLKNGAWTERMGSCYDQGESVVPITCLAGTLSIGDVIKNM